MTKQEKQIVIGAIRSATHKASKIIEKGCFVSRAKFLELLAQSTEWNYHLYFSIERINYEFSSKTLGKPSIEIYCKWKKLVFKSTFILMEPYGKFNNRTPIPQYFKVEEIIEEEIYPPRRYED